MHPALHPQVAPVQGQLLDVQPLPLNLQRALGGGEEDGVLVEALHLLHAGDGQLLPLLQNNVMGHLGTGPVVHKRHSASPFLSILWGGMCGL